MMTQYEIWWAALPLPAGRRPVLLLSRDQAYRYLPRVLVAEITSVARGIPQELALGPGDGLPNRCVVSFDNLRRVGTSMLSGRIAKLAPSRVLEVKRRLGHALMWSELTRL